MSDEPRFSKHQSRGSFLLPDVHGKPRKSSKEIVATAESKGVML
jgi:hypothetical protein